MIVNSDHQRELKGSKAFQDEEERLLIVSNIKAVDKAVLSVDKDRTVCDSIRMLFERYGEDYDLAFCQWGRPKQRDHS